MRNKGHIAGLWRRNEGVLQSRGICRILIALLLAPALLAGCAGGQQSQPEGTPSPEGARQGPLSVYASFYPMYDFAVKIGGERVNAVNMVPAGVEPHDWEPGAADMVGLESADVFIYNGAGMEHWAEDILESLQNPGLVAVEASAGIPLMEGHDDHGDDHGEEEEEEEEGDHEDDHEDGEFDPHVWLDPQRAKTEMLNIRDAFKKADPEGAAVYDANYNKYAAQLDELDGEFSDALAAFSGRDIIVAHEAFGYLCAAYGLNQVPIEGLSPDSEPDPARMAEIIEFAAQRDIKVIFFEELVSPKVAETIAEAVGAQTDVLNPFEGPGDDDSGGGDDYFAVMRSNLAALIRALG